jgi:C1A family cysteine protease
MREIIMQGPVQAIFRVYPDFFMYKSGVYKWSSEDYEEVHYHSVKILGWGTENGEDYWLCANSWGSDWGEQGYFKIKRGDSEINKHIFAAWGNGKINDKVIYNKYLLKRYIRQMYAAIKKL